MMATAAPTSAAAWGAGGEQRVAPNSVERRRPGVTCANRLDVTCGSLYSHWSAHDLIFVDTEEVTGSNPVSPTSYMNSSDGLLPDLR